ncbi:hypothetical protein R5R35_007170 [Gryllus longicercus]|uniref:AN1-type zinc finger protein 4 n=1 Tax=Gryllus longicercus TaxID=2509291 RepID=A0AAN9VJG2_9ORTH
MSQNGLQETFQSSLRPEGTMDLFIETLTGTAFEMTVSPFDTIMSIKSKIQRVEGIPISHQHLLYNLQELDDSSSLIDHSIQNGATLKLVLSMRGGPISTRRVHTGEEFTWKELREFMENGRDDVLDHIPPGCRVTVLVFRDGDQVNLFRVLENEDGTYSPLSESLSGSSIQSLFAEDDPEESAKRIQENSVTMSKMQELRNRMEALALRRKPKKSAPRVLSAKRPLLHSRKATVRVATNHLSSAAEPKDSSLTKAQAECIHLPPIRKAQTTTVPSRQRAISSSYLGTSSFLTQSLPRRSRDTEGKIPGKLDNNSVLTRQPLRTARKDSKETIVLPRRIPSIAPSPPKRPAGRRRSRLTASQIMDAKPEECVEYGASRNVYRSNPPAEPADSSESNTSNNSKGSGILSTSKIAIVESETDSAVDKVEPDLAPTPNSIPVPIPSTEATTFAMSSITRERMSTSVGSGGRYRVSRFLLEEDDRPKTSPDKLTQQQKRAQEICDLLSETKWHRRRQKVNCSSIEELSSDLTRERGHSSLLCTRKDTTEASPDEGFPFQHPIGDLSLVRAPRSQRFGRRSHLLPIAPETKGGGPLKTETEFGLLPQRGSRRRIPSGTLPEKSAADILPLIAPITHPPEAPLKKPIRHRCAQCRKRLNITNMYTCRCEKLFCSAHRYSELHDCTFDYKSEGRKMIEQANPLVTASKLPKI